MKARFIDIKKIDLSTIKIIQNYGNNTYKANFKYPNGKKIKTGIIQVSNVSCSQKRDIKLHHLLSKNDTK